MVNRSGPTDNRSPSSQTEPECSGWAPRLRAHHPSEMSFLNRRPRGGRSAMQGQNKYADGFMDETDREVSSLTDRAFRSLCIGEEAVYADPEFASSPRDAFPLEFPPTFQHSFTNWQDQGLQCTSRLSNGAIEATWQHRQSRSGLSCIMKAFGASESGSGMAVVPDGCRSEAGSRSWERSALLNHNNELSDFPTYPGDPFSPAATLQASRLGPSSPPSKAPRRKSNKATFRKLSSINYFLHSEHSPFQTWADYNRFRREQEATPPPCSPSGFERWYDSPLYKELTAAPWLQTSHSDDVKSYWTPSKDRTPSEPPRSVVKHKAAAVEKRCESEVVAKFPPWRRSRNLLSNQLPVNRPCTASPCSLSSRRCDEASLSTIHHQVHTLADEQTTASATPFSISQLLTPIIHTRQETETSEVSQYELSPAGDLQVWRDTEPRPHQEVKFRDSYKAMASSLLFNLKDNRKRVKSTYSPTKFKSLELMDSEYLPSKEESAAHTPEKSTAGPLGCGSSLCTRPGAAETRSIYSPASQLVEASAVGHTKYTESKTSDDYFTLISPPTLKEATHQRNSDRSLQETAQRRDQLSGSQQSQYRQSQHAPSAPNEILSRNRLSQPTWKEYKTSPIEQEMTNVSSVQGPIPSTSASDHNNARGGEACSVKEKDVIRNDGLLHNEIDSQLTTRKNNVGQEVQVNQKSPNTAAINWSGYGNIRSTRSSAKAEAVVLNETHSHTLQAHGSNGTTEGVHWLKEKFEVNARSSASVQRENAAEQQLFQKEREHSRMTATEIKGKGRVRQEVLKIQASDPANRSVQANRQNPHVLQGPGEGSTDTAKGRIAELPAKSLNKCSPGGLCGVQENNLGTKHTHLLQDKQHPGTDVLPKHEAAAEKATLLPNEEPPIPGPSKHYVVSNRDNNTDHAKAKLITGQLVTGFTLPVRDVTGEQDHMKHVCPTEDYNKAKHTEQTTNEEAINRGHLIIRKTTGEKMPAKNGIKAGTEYKLGVNGGQSADDLEADGQEKREQLRQNTVSKSNVLVQEQKNTHQESLVATESEVKEGVRGGRDNRQPDRFDTEASARAGSLPIGNGEAANREKDLAKGTRLNQSADNDNPKVKHRMFAFNQKDQALQEMLTLKLKAHAQKEITAIKEKGHAKRDSSSASRKDLRERANNGQGDPLFLAHANQGVAIANENRDMKLETPPREFSRSHIMTEMRKENEASPSVEKQETFASPRSGEPKCTPAVTKKETTGDEGLQGLKNRVIDGQDLLPTGNNLPSQKSDKEIKGTRSTKQATKEKHDTSTSENKQEPTNKAICEIPVSVADKQEPLSAGRQKAENVPVNSYTEVTLECKQNQSRLKENASLRENPNETLQIPVRAARESNVPHKEEGQRNDERFNQGALQSKDKEFIRNKSTVTEAHQVRLSTAEEHGTDVSTLPETGSTPEKFHQQPLKEKEGDKNVPTAGTDEGGSLGLGTKVECSAMEGETASRDREEESGRGAWMQNVKDVKEVLGTIEKEFVRINVFAITRKVDAELEDSSSEHNVDSTVCEMNEREWAKQEVAANTDGPANTSTVNEKHEVQTIGEGKEWGFLAKQNCQTTDPITGKEFSQPDKTRSITHDEQEGQANVKPVVVVAEEQCKAVLLVGHEHAIPITQARNKVEPARESPNEEQVLPARKDSKTDEERLGAAIQITGLPVNLDQTVQQCSELKMIQRNDTATGKNSQPHDLIEPAAWEGSLYGKSGHDKQRKSKEKQAQPETPAPLKLPATQNPKSDIDGTKEDTNPQVLATKEAPGKSECYTHNHNVELETVATREHTKVDKSAPKEHQKSDDYSEPPTSSAKEYSQIIPPVLAEHHKKEVSERKSIKQHVFETKKYARPDNQLTTAVPGEHPKPGPCIKPEDSKPGVPVTAERPKPGVRVKPEDSKPGVPVTAERPKPDVRVKPEDSKPGVPVTTEHHKPDVHVKPHDSKASVPITGEHLRPAMSVITECTAPTLEYSKPSLPLSKEANPDVSLTNEHPTPPFRKEYIKPQVPVQKEHQKLDETLYKESKNPQILLTPKGFMSDKALLNNHAKEAAKSEAQTTEDSTDAKLGVYSRLGSSPPELKNEDYSAKRPLLVNEEKDYLSTQTFPSKGYGKAKMGVLTDKEDLSKIRDVHVWMEKDQIPSLKELDVKEDFTGRTDNYPPKEAVLAKQKHADKQDHTDQVTADLRVLQFHSQHAAPTLPLEASIRNGDSVSLKQPVYAKASTKPFNETYLSVQGGQQTLKQEFKAQNRSTESMQEWANKEEEEGLQYYAISSYAPETEAKGSVKITSQRAEVVQKTREAEQSDCEADNTRGTFNATDPDQAHMPSPPSDTSSPSLGKPTLFKVKDNTFKTSPVTKAVKPCFHKTFAEDIQLSSPSNSEKGEDQADGLSEEAKVLTIVHHTAVPSNRYHHPSQGALPPSEVPVTKEKYGYFRKNPVLEEDECCSIVSALSEGIESCTASTTEVAGDKAAILGVTEGPEVLRGIDKRPEPTYSGNEGKTLGKPPVVPPKTEKALRRAQKLMTRRIKKAEAKVRLEGKQPPDQTPFRTVSSAPSSPMSQLLSHHPAPSPPAAPCFCLDSGSVPPAPQLVAQPFPLTERKLLQDPNSGQYFMVEMPVQVKTKTFFDPATGKYIQLSVRQSPEGTLSPASSVELLSPPYVLYPGFLTLPVASVPPLRSSSQMSAPAALAEEQERLELSEPWCQKGYCPEFGRDSQPYIETVYEQLDQPLQKPLHSVSPRKLNIISMSELEDFAVEST